MTVEIAPEGPQRGDLAPDAAEALAANPDAGAFFDGLAQFYRRGYLRWIDGTTRRPELRAERIVEMVRLLEAGHKARPRALPASDTDLQLLLLATVLDPVGSLHASSSSRAASAGEGGEGLLEGSGGCVASSGSGRSRATAPRPRTRR